MAFLIRQGRQSLQKEAFRLLPVSRPLGVVFCQQRQASEDRKWMNKILVANRGEIACRIMQTAKKLGVQTVAVYSTADAGSRHVAMADQAVCIGPPASSESYLCMDKIIKVAQETGAKGIHPGYGFLSENADFALRCQSEGIEFIGPPASAISSMGSKSESKEIMSKSSVPVVPGYHGENQDPAFLQEQADNMGYPVLIKAVKGGGGKGMRVVKTSDEFLENLERAKSESRKHFSDDRVLIEKYIQRPRHVEVQVFADKHGNAVHLFERDCSLQRRHQKVIEEAPAPGLSEERRAAIGDAAVRAALAVNYVGAGTVEFIMDTVTQEFFFMEMNTRLQVEHPVTEMITNVDLVDWQLRIASGYPLPLTQDELKIDGHSFEARIYAENPANNFLPGSGTLKYLRFPRDLDNVRIETGVRQGDDVTVHYDPMIAKLVVKGTDRQQALNKLLTCLGEFNVCGLPTNIEFLSACGSHPEFIAGNVTTDFIPDFEAELLPEPKQAPPEFVAIAAAVRHYANAAASLDNCEPAHGSSPWQTANSFEINSLGQASSTLLCNDSENAVNIEFSSEYDLTVDVNGGEAMDVVLSDVNDDDDSELRVSVNDRNYVVRYMCDGPETQIFTEGKHFTFKEPTAAFLSGDIESASDGSIGAPMTGTIVKIMVEPGQEVKKGQVLAVMEAMKMELLLRAPADGVVAAVNANEGDLVGEAETIIKVDMEVEEN